MRRRRAEEPEGWLTRIGELHSFDQSNGSVEPEQADQRWNEGQHLVAPERLNGISRHFH